ncbi:hypothetical protein BV898_09977 [Hypsibius exemplaris]|uniref:Uncharacterized protein n=1 Tax=Hypsibius exemplaris TaxID=2072580 RepID=A0A1W0WKY2_HYPEX|nr:hypothetical protein BV898_09977 [Hypsibius exemplaris]
MKTEGWESSIPPLNIKPEPEDTGEEVIIYKQFLKNPFFDDHFDLTDAKHRLGKTLPGKAGRFCVGRQFKIMKETVDGFLAALQKKSEASGEEAATTEIKSLMSRAQTAQKLLQDAGALKDGTAVALSEQQVRDAVTATADSVTAQQRAAYEEAVTYRDKEISRQVRRFQLEERLRVLKLQREQLKNEEDLLFFFERKTTWENMLTPEARQAMAAQQAEDGSFYDYRVEDPQYEIPQILTPQTYTPFARWQRRQEDHEAKLRGYKLERFLGEYGRKKRDEKRARKGLKPIGVAAARSLPGDPPNWRELLMKR